MNVAILGYDVEGKVSYDYFMAQGNAITVCDQNPELEVPPGTPVQLGENYLDNLDRFDLLVRTPGLHPRKILDKNPGVADKITTQTNEFFKSSPTKNIIGVTGTKGKGTTSTLIAKMLEATGKQVFVGGNIGVPPLSFWPQLTIDSWVVLELSSYQLIDLKYSPHIAVCLMVVPEHLSWHANMAEYVMAKSQLFAHQTPQDIAIYYSDSEQSKQIARNGQAEKLSYFSEPGAVVLNGHVMIDNRAFCDTSELKLIGEHNWQNVCAAITAVWQVAQDRAAIRSVLTSFTGLPHRLEFVREIDGVRYFNDSYSSGLHATEAGVLAIPGKKVLVAGGYDRMLPLDHFVSFAREHADEFRSILIIGAAGPRLANALEQGGFKNYLLDTDAKTMNDIVKAAKLLAIPGDIVLFSPGFASFDMFKNFTDRGDQFRDVVNGL